MLELGLGLGTSVSANLGDQYLVLSLGLHLGTSVSIRVRDEC